MDFAKLNLSISLNPTSAFPLDARVLFTSYDDAAASALTACEVGSFDSQYYFGETVTVLNNVENTGTVYVIVNDETINNLYQIGKVDLSNYYTKGEIDKKFKATSKEIKNLETAVDDLSDSVDEIKKDVSGMKSDMANIKLDVANVKNDVKVINNNVTNLTKDVQNVKKEIKTITVSTEKVEKEVAEMRVTVDQVKTDVSKLSINVTNVTNRVVTLEKTLDVAQDSGLTKNEETGKLEMKVSSNGNVNLKKTKDGVEANFTWREFE